MQPQDLAKLPGAEIVLPGIEDLKAGRETVNALADRPYRLLNSELGDDAHSRYNAILRRVVSFARAADNARAG